MELIEIKVLSQDLTKFKASNQVLNAPIFLSLGSSFISTYKIEVDLEHKSDRVGEFAIVHKFIHRVSYVVLKEPRVSIMVEALLISIQATI